MARIQTILLSGFLGSGKTTLLGQLVNHDLFRGKKIAVLVNEFGQLPIDGALLPKGDYHIAEINKGSIFCICVKTDLIKNLQTIATDIQPDYLIIEATGLAEPTDFSALLQTELLQKSYEKGTILTVADAVNLPKLAPMMPVLSAQIRIADHIILNKCDLAAQEEIDKAEEIIRTINPNANILQTHFCRIDAKKIIPDHPEISANLVPGTLSPCPPKELPRLLFQTNKIPDRVTFYDVLDKFRHHIIRGKGTIDFGSDQIFIDVVNGAVTSKVAKNIHYISPARSSMDFVLHNCTPEELESALRNVATRDNATSYNS